MKRCLPDISLDGYGGYHCHYNGKIFTCWENMDKGWYFSEEMDNGATYKIGFHLTSSATNVLPKIAEALLPILVIAYPEFPGVIDNTDKAIELTVK